MRRLLALLALPSLAAAAGIDFDHRLEVLHSYSRWRPVTDGPWNPGNRVARLPRERWEQEWRLGLRGEAGDWQARIEPRLSWSSAEPRRDLWLNEAVLRWRGEKVSAQAGREILLWGPSLFWSPSNPFYRRNGRDLPQRELAGHDIARVDLGGDAWSAQLARQFGDGHGDEPGEDAIWSLRAERIGERATLAVLASRADHGRPRFGAYGQATLDEGLIAYADFVLAAREARVAAEAGPGGWTLRRVPDRRYRPTAVLGGGYTWNNGLTLYAEGLYSGAGLSRGEAERDGAAAAALAARGGPEMAMIGALLDSGAPVYRRRYLAFHLTESGAEEYGWALRGTGNLDDGSGELVLQLSRDWGGHARLWGNALGHWGGRGAEYGRLSRGMLWLGVSLFW